MPLSRCVVCVLVCLGFANVPARANTRPLVQQSSFLEKILLFPLLNLFVPGIPTSIPDPGALAALSIPQPQSLCSVAPLSPLDDDEARGFEAAAGTSDVVDLSGLTPATAMALERFERRVTSLGGKFAITSAYRPPAYQAHLQLVWDRWKQLRSNFESGCAVLKAQVEDEFQRHSLLPSQRPVDFSDHTRGVGFDASVFLPRRRFRIDRVAAAAGVRRPDVVRDPVHFRLIGSSVRP